MVKGVTRSVVVVKSPDKKYFEEAIFIVRGEQARRCSAGEIARQAREIAMQYAAPGEKRRFSPIFWVIAGALPVCGAWALCYFLSL